MKINGMIFVLPLAPHNVNNCVFEQNIDDQLDNNWLKFYETETPKYPTISQTNFIPFSRDCTFCESTV